MEAELREIAAQLAHLNETARMLLVAVVVGAFLVCVAVIYAARRVGALAEETRAARESLATYERALAHDAAQASRGRAMVEKRRR